MNYKRVGKGEFRYCLFSEDIINYDKILDSCGTVVVYDPIEVFDTFNPFIKMYDDKIDSGVSLDYSNPYKMSSISKNLIKTIRGFLLMNDGIDDFGIKKMVEFIKKNYVNGGTITFEEISSIVYSLKDEDNESYLREYHPNSFVFKSVFYSKDSLYTKEEKTSITRREVGYIIRRDRRLFIDRGIDFLSGRDSLTKITNKRISSFTGFKRDTVSRSLSVRQKIRIRKINVDRYFNQEKVTDKFNSFIDNYDYYSNKSISEVIKELGISQKYYYKFMEIIELNK